MLGYINYFSYICITNKLYNMNQEKIVNEVKSLLKSVVSYQDYNKYDTFDYGYLYNSNPPYWECEFFNKKGNVVEKITAYSTEELFTKLTIPQEHN